MLGNYITHPLCMTSCQACVLGSWEAEACRHDGSEAERQEQQLRGAGGSRRGRERRLLPAQALLPLDILRDSRALFRFLCRTHASAFCFPLVPRVLRVPKQILPPLHSLMTVQ